jgi:hypothetical protein
VIAATAEWIAATPLAQWAAASTPAYPVANTIHVIALVMLLGGIGLVDLRLLGLFRSLPLQPLARALVPIAAWGVAIMGLSGATMFLADAEGMAASGTFRWKLLLLALALANVALFRWRYGAVPREPVRMGMRLLALASLLLWTATAVAGRLIAYT